MAVLAHQQQRAVGVQVVKTSWNSRLIHASVDVHADLECVWKALTDYENLGQFIPSLVENRCLERRGNGAVLYQVGLGLPAPLSDSCWAVAACGALR